MYDAIVVGSGPNGLAAAVELARAGRRVQVREATDRIGGGTRTEALTLPGFLHDVCSAVHPLGIASPFFRSLPLTDYGVEWIQPDAPLAHPFDDGSAAVLERSLEETARAFDPADRAAYRSLFAPFLENCDRLLDDVLAPVHVPRHPVLLARFGLRALRSASGLAASLFRSEHARGLFAGIAAHSVVPLTRPATAAFGILLGLLGHVSGWPICRGGSRAIATALAEMLRRYGGEIETGAPVESMNDLPPARAVVFDLTPRQLVRIAGERLPARYRRRLERFRYGPGTFKVDWALAGPIPWTASECSRAGTVHLGGTLEEVAAAESTPWRDAVAERPFVLLSQPSLFDPTRAPPGRHTAWAYCHVPHASSLDVTDRIEAQVERFAPGFRDVVLARSVLSPLDLERHNANLIGGDIGGGSMGLRQLFFRPTASLEPYRTPAGGIFLCSSSTPPGGGVHGMCGYHAARSVMRAGL